LPRDRLARPAVYPGVVQSPASPDPVLARVSRTRRVALGAVVVLMLFGVAAGACGGSDDASTNTADTTTTIDETEDTGPSSLPKGTFKPKGTFPKGTFKPKTTTTTAPKVTTTKAPPTTKAPVTTKAPPPPTEPLSKKFCEYIATVDLGNISDDNWAEGFNRLYVGVTNALQVAPPVVKQAVLDLKATVDALRPAVDAGQIASNAQLAAWFVAQTPDTQTRIKAAGKQIQLYAAAQCH